MGRDLALGALGILVLTSACSSQPEPTTDEQAIATGGVVSGIGGTAPTGGTRSGTGGAPIVIATGGDQSETGGEGGGEFVNPCAGDPCPDDQSCAVEGDSYVCVPNDCATLACLETEECETTANGARCNSIACDDDVDCPPERFCDTNTGVCADDTCVAGARRCMDVNVEECSANGGGYEVLVTCQAATAFVSVCVDLGGGSAGCTCEDDWDCPDYQDCEAGVCRGNPEPPTCSLPPLDITAVLPSLEIKWGGEDETDIDARLRLVDGVAVPDAPASPWPNSAQVVHTPIVANLDDDNGDGLIDERDFAEIVFLTFCDDNHFTGDGLLRAIHGGGVYDDGTSKKGRDYLAVCNLNRWHEGTYYDEADTVLDVAPECDCDAPDLDSTSTIAVGDLDYDGVPEIVAWTEADTTGGGPGVAMNKSTGALVVYNNEGRRLLRYPESGFIEYEDNGVPAPAVALANVIVEANPADEVAEIVVGSDVFRLTKVGGGLSVQTRYAGRSGDGVNFLGPIPCVADLAPDRPGQEIVAGAAVYAVPQDAAATEMELLAEDDSFNGFCAVADVWGPDTSIRPGPDNDPATDRRPEIIVIGNGELRVYTFGPADGGGYALVEIEAAREEVPGGSGGGQDTGNGGPPNVDDFDGDGFMEIGTAGETGYQVFDLQEPVDEYCPRWPGFDDTQATLPRTPPTTDCTACAAGTVCNTSVHNPQCVCLHNGWTRGTKDDSSRVTGSSVFDFNGDGAAEVVYNDECFFRIYSGIDGSEVQREWSESRTRTEYPIVADVDNDGNAEIVFATSNESGFCMDREPAPDPAAPDNIFNNGIEVWGDPDDRWVSARRVWNQHAYHVTNITESLLIPREEPASWLPFGNRFYNTYRSQPRSYGTAPDLVVAGVQVTSPDAVCGQLSNSLLISVQVRNDGDLRVGPGVIVVFDGVWAGGAPVPLLDANGAPLTYVIANSLEPGDEIVFQVPYESSYNGQTTRPDRIIVTVDPATDGNEFGAERECDDANNTLGIDVEPGDPLADLTLVLNASDDDCPTPKAWGTVSNIGALAASNIVVRIYAGNPEAGGELMGEVIIPGPIEPGGSADFELVLVDFPLNKSIRLYGIVDPDDQIRECNDGNNKDGPTDELFCLFVG